MNATEDQTMPARTIAKGDIIEIVQIDSACRKTLRRVRVKRMERADDGGYHVIGVNMKGEHGITYVLPRLALRKIVKTPNTTGWMPFDDSAPADE